MRTDKRVLALGAMALLSACGRPAVVGPPAAPGGAGLELPTFSVLAVTQDYTAAEDAVLAGVNTERAANGLPALVLWETLRPLAREHSQDMATRHYFNHTTPDGLTPYARVRAAGIPFSTVGETSHFPDIRPASAVADWLRHPGGKAQMLSDRFTEAAVGIAYSSAELRHYVNVIYLRPAATPPAVTQPIGTQPTDTQPTDTETGYGDTGYGDSGYGDTEP